MKTEINESTETEISSETEKLTKNEKSTQNQELTKNDESMEETRLTNEDSTESRNSRAMRLISKKIFLEDKKLWRRTKRSGVKVEVLDTLDRVLL